MKSGSGWSLQDAACFWRQRLGRRQHCVPCQAACPVPATVHQCIHQPICPRSVDICDFIRTCRRLITDTGFIPSAFRDALFSIRSFGNPWSQEKEKRTLWTRGLEVPPFNNHEYLLWTYSSAPEIRNLTASEAGMAVQRYARIKPSYDCDVNGCEISLDGFYDEAWLMMSTEAKPGSIIGGTVTPVSDGLYLIEASNPVVSIRFKE